MKIFNIENGKEVVYVQINDLKILNYSMMDIPSEVLKNMINDIDMNDGKEFIKFTNKDTIDFFKSNEYIVDYKKEIKLDNNEIKNDTIKVMYEMNDIANKFNSYSFDEKLENSNLLDKHELLKYKFYNLRDLLWFKEGNIDIKLPKVPDSDGFSFEGSDNCLYEFRSGLNPKELYILKTNGEKFKMDDKIPQDFLTVGISIFLMEKNRKDNYNGEYDSHNMLSKDKKYFIIRYDERKPKLENNKESKIKKIIKKFKKEK